jgi:hypothetical protein
MVQALSVTVQKNPFMDGSSGGPHTDILDWTADASGSVSIAVASTYAAAQKALNPYFVQPIKVSGKLMSVETIPGASGVPATNPPNAGYNVAIQDKYGYDIMAGTLVNRSGAIAEKQPAPSTMLFIDSELTLVVSGAGANTQGRVVVEFDEFAGHKF